MAGMWSGDPYRTSAKTKDDIPPSWNRHYKEELTNIDVSFSCDDGKGGIVIYNRTFDCSPIPDELEFKHGRKPYLYDGNYHFHQYLQASVKCGYLYFGTIIIPWHRFIEAQHIKTTSSIVEFDWLEKPEGVY